MRIEPRNWVWPAPGFAPTAPPPGVERIFIDLPPLPHSASEASSGGQSTSDGTASTGSGAGSGVARGAPPGGGDATTLMDLFAVQLEVSEWEGGRGCVQRRVIGVCVCVLCVCVYAWCVCARLCLIHSFIHQPPVASLFTSKFWRCVAHWLRQTQRQRLLNQPPHCRRLSLHFRLQSSKASNNSETGLAGM